VRRETPALLPFTQDAIREAGGIPPLVYLLQAGNDDDVLEATGAWTQPSALLQGWTQPPLRGLDSTARCLLSFPLLTPLPSLTPCLQARWRSCA
jgi:hypothetical protein